MPLHNDNRGAVAIIVAMSMVVLIGLLAYTVDVGVVYQEKRELQNGAEAAALAIAQGCATGELPSCGVAVTGVHQAMAAQYAQYNIADGSVGLIEVSFPTSNTIRVATGSQNDSGADVVDTIFAPILGIDGVTVTASAEATWGGIGAATATPLIFGTCEYNLFGDGGPSVGQTLVVKFHNSGGETECNGPAGQDAPGGFGWLETNGSCLSVSNVGDWFKTSPGVSTPGSNTECGSTDKLGLTINGNRNTQLLIPLFDEIRGTGSGTEFHLYGYAGLSVQGWYFTAGIKGDPFDVYDPLCKSDQGNSSDDCVVGTFVGFFAPGEVGGGPDLGPTTFSLTG